MTELFKDLYRRALQKDHPILAVAIGMMHELETDDIVHCCRVAQEALKLGESLEDKLVTTGRMARLRVADIRYACPICARSECPYAVPYTTAPPPAKLLQYFLAGGKPPPYLK